MAGAVTRALARASCIAAAHRNTSSLTGGLLLRSLDDGDLVGCQFIEFIDKVVDLAVGLLYRSIDVGDLFGRQLVEF